MAHALNAKQVKAKLAAWPTPSAGLALGIASLGISWEHAFALNGNAQLLAAAIAAVMIVMVFTKFALHPEVLWHELSHPVIGSVIPTSAMTAMVLSASVTAFNPAGGALLWYCAVAAHLLFLLVFTFNRARQFNLQHMVPSWFVPPVGLVVAVLTVPNEGAHGLADTLLTFGITSYAVLLPLMLYRMIFVENITDAAKPTIAIMAAPPSLCLAGYLSFVEQPDMLLTLALLGIALLMTTVIYVALWPLLRLPFSPGYAAFTFPLVISATAMFKASEFAVSTLSPELAGQLHNLAMAQLVVATLVVSYVALRYLNHFGARRFGLKVATT
ncbi:MAG: TDT family transporter [Marinobacterium sp.]|nr:TDT family transporter [Marinobacterium sp.]